MATLAHEDRPSATLGLEQALDLAPIAHARMVGSQWFMLLYPIAGVVLGMLAGSVASALATMSFVWTRSELPEWLPLEVFIALGGIMGYDLGYRGVQRRHRSKFLGGIRRRGTPTEAAADYGIEDAGLRIRTSRVQYLIAWDAILELIDTPEVWLIQVDLTTFLLAKAAFADQADQRSFLGEILSRIRPEARDRSLEAVAFATPA